MDFLEKIEELRRRAFKELSGCNKENLSNIHSKYLGRKGALRELFMELSRLSLEQKREFGRLLNAFKSELEKGLEERKNLLSLHEQRKVEYFDPTMPGKSFRRGRRHPVYQTMDQIKDIFERLGFSAVYGPEIESEYNNFEALNMPAEHPSRDAFHTFYIREGICLRSHTSPVQIRIMRQRKPPLRIIAPGKVFRPDTPDASHAPMFHQVEGLMVEEDVSFAHLKGVLELFVKEFFGEDVKMRFKPSYFPFVEPGAEVEILCMICKGSGCSTCGGGGWVEILGAGMVHPNVFRNVGYDPERYTGFAFGMGVERITMLRYLINDIRLFTENHYRFLRQF